MSALERFEDWFQQRFEAGLAGLLGAHIQPVDLARRLADHMDDHLLVGPGRRYAPNTFRVYLAPRTLTAFTTFQAALEDELAVFLTARASERGYHLVGRVRVSLWADAGLRPEQLRLESDVVDAPAGGDRVDHTQAIDLPPALHVGVAPTVVLTTGPRRSPIAAPGPVTVGRALDNDIILDDPSVSRHHARFVVRGQHWLLEDLSSLHGSYVNTRQVTAAMLRPGDRVRFGAVIGQIEAATEHTPT
jgi:hypothetical protein